jgi:hypothetical protein
MRGWRSGVGHAGVSEEEYRHQSRERGGQVPEPKVEVVDGERAVMDDEERRWQRERERGASIRESAQDSCMGNLEFWEEVNWHETI